MGSRNRRQERHPLEDAIDISLIVDSTVIGTQTARIITNRMITNRSM